MAKPQANEVSLLDVGDFIRGVSYERDESEREPRLGLVPIIRANNLARGSITFDDLVYVPKSRISAAQRLRKGDIVIAMSSGSADVVGKAALVNDDWSGAFGAFCGLLRPSEQFDSRFVAQFLKSPGYRHQVASVATGTNINNLSRTTLSQILIPKPSLPMQKSIAQRLDSLADRQVSISVKLTAARRAIDRFRQCVLVAACSPETPDSGAEWRTLPLGDLVKTLDQGWSPQCLNRPRADAEEWGVIKTTAIQALAFKPGENKALPPSLKARQALSLEPGDLLITRAGPRTRVGISCLVRDCPPRLMLCDKAYRIRVDRTRVLEEYLEFVLNSPEVLELIESMKTGTSDSGMNLTQKGLLLMPVSIPDLEEQHRIVELTRGLLRQADQVASSIGLANTALNRAVSSTLEAFFRGSPPIATPSRSAFRRESRATP